MNWTQARRISRCETVSIRGLRYNVRHWGEAESPSIFLLHGWMDSSATFQFVVDALAEDWHVIAPDWRGYGASEWLARPYWFQDYFADLDALLTHYAKDEPVRLVGHSMGANIAGTYAGARPHRVRQLAMLDFLGLEPTQPEHAPERLANWLGAIDVPPVMRRYRDYEALARRLKQSNPRLTAARADFLARNVSRLQPDGQVVMACDPWHKIQAPVRFQTEDVLVTWRRITAPVITLLADQGYAIRRFGDKPAELERRLACFADHRNIVIEDSAHNVQHDQPEQVAAALEGFFMRDQ